MKKYLLIGLALLSINAFAQNIDTGYEEGPSGLFMAIGVDESHWSVAEDDMRGNANRVCGYGTGAQQVSTTRFRSVYTYRYASAEFRCFGGRLPYPGPHRRCSYYDDSNPYCLRHSENAILE